MGFTATKNIIHRASRFFSVLLAAFLLHVTCVAKVFGWDRPFNNASNWGGTGLMEIPTARVLEDGVVRLGVAQAKPYRWYTGAMGIFPGLEFGGRFTELTNVESNLGDDYGNYRDKAFDFKYQILPESKKFPAIAIGLQDFTGTQLFSAQYIVFSRQIFPFDFSVGIGRERLSGGISPPLWDRIDFLEELGLFGGIEWALHERLHLLVEYNPIEYENDIGAPGEAVPEKAKWPVNLGARIRILDGLDLGISYQRGDTLGFSFHLQTKLGVQILPQKPDPPLRHAVDRRPFSERDTKEMVEKIYSAVSEAGFSNIVVYTNGLDLTAEFANGRYLSNQKAVGRVLGILLFHSPSDTEKLIVRVKRRHFPILEVSVEPEHLEKYLFGKIGEDVFSKLLHVETAAAGPNPEEESIAIKEDERLDLNYGIKPDLETYFNDPSGVFKYRVGMKPYASSTFWRGGSAYARYDIPFYSNISSSAPTVPDPVRSDSWKYSDRDYSFDRLLFDQAFRLSDRTFGRLSVGYFERMYAGFGGEVLRFFGDGKLALGIEGDWVRKREPGTQFSLMDFKSHTLLANLYYLLPGIDVSLQAQYGRFLAGDLGWMFYVSREYETGVRAGFWYSFTDTDDLTAYNKGYNEKGVFVSIPARIFLNRDSSARYGYGMSPWTRDVAATVYHWQDLFGLGAGLMPAEFREKLGKIRE